MAPSTLTRQLWALTALDAELGAVRLRRLDVDTIERALDRIATGRHGRGRPLARVCRSIASAWRSSPCSIWRCGARRSPTTRRGSPSSLRARCRRPRPWRADAAPRCAPGTRNGAPRRRTGNRLQLSNARPASTSPRRAAPATPRRRRTAPGVAHMGSRRPEPGAPVRQRRAVEPRQRPCRARPHLHTSTRMLDMT